MRKIITFVIILANITFASFAQSPGSPISGEVKDAREKTVEGASVSLRSGGDSSLVKSSATDSMGRFSFASAAPGDYFVEVTAVGYSRTFSRKFAVAAGHAVNLKVISLHAVTKDLSTVTVTARKALIEQKIDRMVVNVDAAVSNVGASALEVLEKSPGITVDKDGNISLKGKQSVLVMIDGKPSYLSGTELVNLLRNMNANQLDQIEIMTNPPAKYDAAGNSGVINIKTKKNKQKGFNGSLSTGYSQGEYSKTNNSLNLNYRNGRINAFTNLSYNMNNGFQQLDIMRKYRNENGKDVNAIFEQTSLHRNHNENRNVKAGLDYYLTEKTTLGVVASGFISPESWRGANTSYLKDATGIVDSIVYSTSTNKDKWKNGTINVNFRHQFDSTGRELSADLDYVRYASNNHQNFINKSYHSDWTPKNRTDLMGILPIDISIYSAKADYTQTLKNGIKLETGWKSSFVATENTANYFNLQGADWIPDYSKTNNFDYKENINAAYINLSRKFQKFGVQAGLRYENTTYEGRQAGNPERADSAFRNSYNSLFPTVYLSYTADKNNQFGFNVGRRIDRPAYQDLNPFLFFLDNYTFSAGNPYLKPQFSTNLELSHTFKAFLTTTLNYSRTKNFFTETFEQSGYATIVRNGNIGTRNNAGVSVSAQVPVQKWWTAVIYANYNYNQFSGKLYGEELKVEAGNFMVNVNNQFKFAKGWAAELSGFYRTKGIEGQIQILPLGQVSAGVSKQVLSDKGSIRFNIRDMFYTQKIEGFINFQKTEAHFWNQRDSRVANLTFTYRFGKPLKGVKERRKTGNIDEQNRVKINNN